MPVRFVADAKPVDVRIDGLDWGFSLRAFIELVEDVEIQSGWHYTGDPCLVIANAYFDGSKAHLDFRRSIRINFREALEDKAIGTPTELADSVFEFAKLVNEDTADPVWEMSDKFGVRLVKKGLKEAFLSLLPGWLSSSAKAGFHFVVHENYICKRRPVTGDIQLQCGDCGQDFTFTSADQTFFQERGYSTPKRCKPCRMAKKNDQGGGGGGYRSAPAQGTPVICSGCGQPTTVPFEPHGDRPVFCRDCYQARKGSGGGTGDNRSRSRY